MGGSETKIEFSAVDGDFCDDGSRLLVANGLSDVAVLRLRDHQSVERVGALDRQVRRQLLTVQLRLHLRARQLLPQLLQRPCRLLQIDRWEKVHV